jgi:hypothetical protein
MNNVKAKDRMEFNLTIRCTDPNCGCTELARTLELAGLSESIKDYDLKAKYDLFNKRFFGGMLPDIPVKFRKMKGKLGGVCDATVRLKPGAPKPHPTFKQIAPQVYYKNFELVPGSMSITINTTYQRSEQGLDGILLHEMIHAQLNVEGNFGDNHGPDFIKRAKEISAQVGFAVPLKDEQEGLELTNGAKPIAVLLVRTKTRTTFALTTPKVAEASVETVRGRYESYRKLGYDVKLVIVSSDAWTKKAEDLALQRTIGTYKDKNYYLTDKDSPELLPDLNKGKVLLHLTPETKDA